jgi:hypothetical protein
VHRTTVPRPTENQATCAARVIRVCFYNLTCLNGVFDVCKAQAVVAPFSFGVL